MRNSIKLGKNVGWMIERCRYNLRERIFAESWVKFAIRTNTQDRLQTLFTRPENRSQSGITNAQRTVITRRDRWIVATIIQWLGTNIGFSFLEECLNRCGYAIVRGESAERSRAYGDPYYPEKTNASAFNNLIAELAHHTEAIKIPARLRTRPFKKKHILRHRPSLQFYEAICIRCGWIQSTRFRYESRDSGCLWTPASEIRREHARVTIEEPDRTPDAIILETHDYPFTGREYIVQLKRALHMSQIAALKHIRINGFQRAVRLAYPVIGGNHLHFKARIQLHEPR